MTPTQPPAEPWLHPVSPAGQMQGREPRDVIVIGAACGGLSALCKIAAALPRGFEVSILVALDIASQPASSVLQILGNHSRLPVGYATHNAPVLQGRIMLAPRGDHMSIAQPGIIVLAACGQDPDEAVDCVGRPLVLVLGALPNRESSASALAFRPCLRCLELFDDFP